MNEKEINNEIDNWTSTISKYIISRSSRFISAETQKDGRLLLIISALSSLFFIGMINIDEIDIFGVKLKFIYGIIFIPFIVEIVCLYFACSFMIDAYSEVKVWQFNVLVKGSDVEDPWKHIENSAKEITKKGEDIFDKYKVMIEAANKKFGLDEPIEMYPDNYDSDKFQDYTNRTREKIENKKKLGVLLDAYHVARTVELNNLDIERKILRYKIDSFGSEIPGLVKMYKFKRYINIVFPMLSFGLSIITLIFYCMNRF